MAYRYITISGRIADLGTIMSENYANGVHQEESLARAAPQLLDSLERLVEMHDAETFVCGEDDQSKVNFALTTARQMVRRLRGENG